MRLAGLLTDRDFSSGQAIAAALGCTRAAVWKQVEALRGLGIGIEAAAGKGYRLLEPIEMLNKAAILRACGTDASALLNDLVVLAETPSTNDAVLGLEPGLRHGAVVLAELQSAGRGRRDRSWYSPFARNIYLSLGWRFESGLKALSCLPLVVAIAAANAIEQAGLNGLGIKWPNDLLLDGNKLAGCLVEVQGDLNGPCLAVMGIGVNLRMRGEPGAGIIDQPWTDMASQVPGVSRNGLAGNMLGALLTSLGIFQAQGFGPFLDDWQRLDCLAGYPVTVHRGDERLNGIARGVSPQGGLLLQRSGAVEELLAGEVTLRTC